MVSKYAAARQFGCFLALVVHAMSAAALEGPGDVLTPAAAAEEALRTNPDLRAAYAVIEIARGRLVQAGLWPNPELSLSVVDDFAFQNEGERGASVGLAQRFPIARRLARARDLARVDVALAVTEVREFERTLIGEVKGAVVSLLALDRAIVEQSRVIAAAGTLAQASSERFRVAEVSEADVNLLEIELARFRQDLRLLELERGTEGLRLNQLLNRPPEPPVAVAGDLGAPLFSPSAPGQLAEDAISRRPDLHRFRLEQDRAGAEVRLARAEAWEDWTLGFGWDFDRQVFENGPIGVKRDDFVGLGLTVPLPVFNRNQGRITAAEAEGRRAVAQASGRERLVEMEVGTEFRRVAELTRIAVEYRDHIVPRATRNVRLLEKGYREGLVGVAALVQAEQQYAEAAIRYARTLGELRHAEVDLETAAAASPLLKTKLSTEGKP